jgi:hypothetical protein
VPHHETPGHRPRRELFWIGGTFTRPACGRPPWG